MRVVLLALLVVLAGCAKGGGEEVPEQGGRAGLEGVVVDAAIVPIEGVRVAIERLEVATTTDANGSFFLDVEPGNHVLDVSKDGFLPVEVLVSTGEVVQVKLERIPATEAFFETTRWSGHLRCGVSAVAVAFPCGVVRELADIVGDDSTEVLELPRIPDWLQTELHWESTQPLGENLQLSYAHCCDNHAFAQNGTMIGPSPLTVNSFARELGSHPGVSDDGVEVRVYGGPLEGTTTGGTWGVGVQLEQPVESITTKTFNFRPAKGWTFIADGDPM